MSFNPRVVTVEIVAGGDETGAGVDVAVAGMTAVDRVIVVYMLSGGTVLDPRPRHDFSAEAAKMTCFQNARDTTGDKYLIFWDNIG